MLKIIGGEFRSRHLRTPDDEESTRPYTARVRESIFNILRGWFEGARVLDLFAGVGTMGLEAVSRGAATVMLVEQQRHVFRLLEENISTLGCGDRATAVQADALSSSILSIAPNPVDVAFVDPPYPLMDSDVGRDRVLSQVKRVRSIMAEQSFLVLRIPHDPVNGEYQIPGFTGPEIHRYSHDMWVLLYCPDAGADGRDPLDGGISRT